MSIMKDLYNGKLYPYADISPSGLEYRQVNAKLETLYTSLVKKMPSEIMETFKEWEHLSQKSGDMQVYESFSHGFRIGVMLMHEVFSSESGENCPLLDTPSLLKSTGKNMVSE